MVPKSCLPWISYDRTVEDARERRGMENHRPVREKPAPGMAEKYFHSRGAASYDEGRFDQAIRFFKKALALEEHHYTRCHLGLSYLGKRDLDRALKEMNRAIELAPSNAEYYHQRAAIWRLKGDVLRADADEASAVRLDANYGRIRRIRAAAQALRCAFSPVGADELYDNLHIRDADLSAIVDKVRMSIDERAAAVEGRSCLLACPAYCCHFSKEPVLHGLWIGPWKLQAIRRSLSEKGLKEADALGKLPFGRQEECLRLIPPHFVVKEAGERVVFYPKRKGRPLGKDLLRGLPKTIDYREPAWITAGAGACAFLADERCVIHDLGDEEALPACKEFLCLTGYVFLVLDYLGLPCAPAISARPMEALNPLAVEALLLLSERLYGNEDLRRLETAMQDALKGAVEADMEKDQQRLASLLSRYRELQKEHEQAFSAQAGLLKEDIRRLLGP